MHLLGDREARRSPDASILPGAGKHARRPGRKRDRAAKQRALLAAAKKLFAHRGYDATTTREIAAHAGCAEGLIHRYFKGKAGLFLALIQNRDSQDPALVSRGLPASSRLEDEIVRLVDSAIDGMWDDREFLKVIVPRALHDPAVGKVLLKVATTSRGASSVVARLRRFPESSRLEDHHLEAYAQLIDLLSFSYGFLRPVMMGQDHLEAKKSALLLVRTLVRQHHAK